MTLPNMKTDALLTTQQVADMLRVCRDTVRKLARAGEIPAVRVLRAYRFRQDEVEAWLSRKAWERVR